jgi:hypothetical protein
MFHKMLGNFQAAAQLVAKKCVTLLNYHEWRWSQGIDQEYLVTGQDNVNWYLGLL